MEEQILLSYLKVFSIILIFVSILVLIFISNTLNKKIILINNSFEIKKGEKFENVIDNIKNFSDFEKNTLKLYNYSQNLFFNKFIHFGDFYIKNDVSAIEFVITIYKPSNNYNKITIIEGWSKDKLNSELLKYFKDFREIDYNNIIADTYFFEKNIDFKIFLNKLKKTKTKYFNKYINHKLLKSFSKDEIIIIGSLIEKEGLDVDDKKNIASVIFNRLNKKMRLQIDATVLYAITDGKFNLDRSLTLKDLKFNHSYNTYLFDGLPPKPISYVGRETLDIIFENYSTDFLFYFFNYSLNRHIFSKTYEEHLKKLNDYRNSK